MRAPAQPSSPIRNRIDSRSLPLRTHGVGPGGYRTQGGRTHAEGTQLVNYNPIGSGGGIQAISTRQVLLFAPLPKPVLVVGERTLKKIHS
ncbi:MAG: hypothetical protein E6F98_11245 [Actinobacteria bacterium]|nr:MAG: hypothetical protein E6F98_11245 [Actinomycetota bacterium]